MQETVAYVTLGMSVICFILFVLQSIGVASPKPVGPAKQVVERARGLTPVSVSEATELIKAMASLGDSLGKAGPAIASLIGTVLLAAIAAIASGALVGTPQDAKKGTTQTAATAPAGTGKTAAGGTPGRQPERAR